MQTLMHWTAQVTLIPIGTFCRVNMRNLSVDFKILSENQFSALKTVFENHFVPTIVSNYLENS